MNLKNYLILPFLIGTSVATFSIALAAHDTLAPTVPRGVTGHGASDTTMRLMWWPSQDNSGIDFYNIYRCQSASYCTPTLIGTSPANVFTDSGLTPSVGYYYEVTAVDPEGNESSHSVTRDGYSRGIFTTPGGSATINVTNSPATVAPNQTFSVSWQPVTDPASTTFTHHDAHFHDSLEGYGCNPPNCWYAVNLTNNAGVYSVNSTAHAATTDIYWVPDPHISGTGFSGVHHHYPLVRIVVTNGNPLAFTTTSLPSASLNSTYSQTLSHNNSSEAVGPFSCGISAGRLPVNLLLNSSTCVLSGTPTESGTFTFTARVKATSENYAMQSLTLTVNGGGGGDTTPPTTSLTAPVAGATISGTTTAVSANASDAVGVVGVQFLLDGENLGAEDTASPYSITWDTTQAANGSHTLYASARDAAGNQTTSVAVSVTVSNTTSDTIPPARSGGSPSGALASGTNQATLSLGTDENATCRYGTTAGTSYASLPTTFSTTGGTTHSDTVPGLTTGSTYSYYVRCQDSTGNTNITDYTINFSVTSSSSGNEFYVDQNHPSCSDAGPGTSESAPWCTFTRAMQSSVVAGATVYVKNGTYSIATDNGFSPVNSGTAGNPIAYRAYTPPSGPRHTPVIQNTSDDDGTIGNAGQAFRIVTDYIVVDGFTTGAYDGVLVFGALSDDVTGTVIENMHIQPGASIPTACGNNNYAAIWLHETNSTVIQNNRIHDVRYTGCAAKNANGILLYDSTNTTIRNNEIYNSHSALSDKEGSQYTTFELNYVHDITTSNNNGSAIFVQGFDTARCDAPGGGSSCIITGLRYRYNVFVNIDIGVEIYLYDAENLDSDIDTYNNTFYNVRVGLSGSSGAPGGLIVPGLNIYNNIIVNSGSGDYTQIGFPSNPGLPADKSSDYNLHRFLAGSVRFRIPGGGYETLSEWQARGSSGFDNNSLTSDPLFAGPFPATTPAAFQLQNTSPARNAGRMGGIASGASVNIGAYATGSEVIGIGGTTPTGDTTSPAVSLITPASGATVSGTTVTVSANASDNVAVSGVQFLLDDTNLGGEDTISPYSITWNTTAATNGSHSLSARARDAAGNQTTSAGVTVTVNNTTTDAQAPTTPANLTATPISSTQINLSWTASTDNVGVSGYRIYRDSVQIATTTSTSYSSTGLSPGTSYSYAVAAYDVAGNASAQSTGTQATTQTPPDITPPNRPTGVTVQPEP